MLISTLPDLPGRTFQVLGFVVAHATLGAIGGGNPQRMIQELIEQAQRFGADAIVDVKTVIGGDAAYCLMTGTAVKLTQ
ncbi:MAG TPA: heavy metal-binding domain-containing protein [Candidatus Limnocylindrales bacterium]